MAVSCVHEHRCKYLSRCVTDIYISVYIYMNTEIHTSPAWQCSAYMNTDIYICLYMYEDIYICIYVHEHRYIYITRMAVFCCCRAPAHTHTHTHIVKKNVGPVPDCHVSWPSVCEIQTICVNRLYTAFYIHICVYTFIYIYMYIYER